MILVTGAAGKTGRAVIGSLARQGLPVRAFVYRSDYVEVALSCGAADVVVGDLCDRRAVSHALKGVQGVYHICPNMHPEEVTIGRLVINCAEKEGVERFVYHSVLHPQIEAMAHHWKKMRVEEQLFEANLVYTIVQPTAYMQNILGNWSRIADQGVFQVPYSTGARLSLVDLEDVAAVAARLWLEASHEGATYELAGTKPIDQRMVAEYLAEVLDRPVSAVQIEQSAWRRQAVSEGLGPYQVETLQAMFDYYDHFGLVGNPNVLGWLVGRRPTSLREFLLRVVGEKPD